MRAVPCLFILIACCLSSNAFGGAERSPPAGYVARIGIFSESPESVRDQVKKMLAQVGAEKAGEVELGKKIAGSFYFHVFLTPTNLANLVETIDGRFVVNITKDYRARQVPKGMNRVILTVLRQAAPPNQEDIRVFQSSGSPDEAVATIRTGLLEGGVKLNSLREIKVSDEKISELIFDLPGAEIKRLLHLGLRNGTLEARFESQPQSDAKTFKVRYLIAHHPVQATDNREFDEKGTLYVFRLSVPVLRHEDIEKIKSALEEQGAVKAGVVDLGTLISGRPYFHFTISDAGLSRITPLIVQTGTLEVERRPHVRRVPRGHVRVMMEVLPLIQAKKIAPVAEVPLASAPSPLPDPEPEPIAEATPKPIVRSEQISKPLELVDANPDAHTTYIDSQTPEQTYHSSFVVRGFAEPGVQYEADGKPVPIDEKTREFSWKLTGLEKEKSNERYLTSKTDSGQSKYVYRLTRSKAWDINAGFGAAPVPKYGFQIFAGGAIRWYFDQLIDHDRDPWEFQRFSIGYQVIGATNKPGGKAQPVPRPNHTVDLRYRFSPGLHEQGNYFSVAAAYKNVNYGAAPGHMLGLGAEYSAAFPRFIDMLVNWIPLLDYPKRYDLGIFTFPYIWGTKNFVRRDYLVYFEPKMYFTPQFYIFGRVHLSNMAVRVSMKDIRANQVLGYGGFGYIF